MLLVRLMTVVLILAGAWVGFNALTEIGQNPLGFVTAAAMALGAWFAAALLIALDCIYDRLGDIAQTGPEPQRESLAEQFQRMIRGGQQHEA